MSRSKVRHRQPTPAARVRKVRQVTTRPRTVDAARLATVLSIATALALTHIPARADDTPLPSDPVFTALSTDGTSVSGRIRRFGPAGEVTLVTEEGPERVIPLDSLVKLTRNEPAPPMAPEASVILFPDGDRIYRTAVGAATETALDVQSYSLSNVAVPLDSLLGIVSSVPPDPDSLEAAVRRVRTEPRTTEVLWLANGDRLRVGFLGLTEKSVEFQSGPKADRIDRARVVALGFDPTLVSYPRPKGGFFELTLTDGSRVGVSGPKVEQGNLVATTRFGARVKVPLADVLRAHARTGSVVYLTERPLAGEKYVPYVGPPRPYRVDATVEGHPMRLSGQEFDRGIGTQSRTLLAYRLEPGDRRFQALVGLDDRAGPLGNVVFKVRVDDHEAFVSPPMSAGDPAKTVDVDVSGGKTLILFTEFGERGGVRDIADWVEARIIR
jgi:hypothetical protein